MGASPQTRGGARASRPLLTSSTSWGRNKHLPRRRGWGADLVTEFVGVPAAVEEGARLLRQGGRYLWIGNITPGLPSALDPGTVVRTAQTIRGVAVWEPWALPRALDFLRRRRHAYPFHKILSDVFPFADIDGAFRRAETGSAIRVSLSMA